MQTMYQKKSRKRKKTQKDQTQRYIYKSGLVARIGRKEMDGSAVQNRVLLINSSYPKRGIGIVQLYVSIRWRWEIAYEAGQPSRLQAVGGQ